MAKETWFHVCGIEHQPETLTIVEVTGSELDAPEGSVWQSLSRLSAEDFIERSHAPDIVSVNVALAGIIGLPQDDFTRAAIEALNDLYSARAEALGY